MNLLQWWMLTWAKAAAAPPAGAPTETAIKVDLPVNGMAVTPVITLGD